MVSDLSCDNLATSTRLDGCFLIASALTRQWQLQGSHAGG